MTTTPAPKGADIEKFRAGFEAWAGEKELPLLREGDADYFYQETGMAWDAWAAAKCEESAENIAKLPPLPLGIGAGQFIDIADVRKYGAACFAVGRGSSTSTSQGAGIDAYPLADALYERGWRDARNEKDWDARGCDEWQAVVDAIQGAAPGDALDAARWRWLKAMHDGGDDVWFVYGADSVNLERDIDAAIAASTTQQGKA